MHAAQREVKDLPMDRDRVGLLLINLGTPDSTRVEDVRRYLREFLSDPRVIDIPAPARAVLLNAVILPRRPRQSAEAYSKIWTSDGSPLLVYTKALADKVQQRLPSVCVEFAMRYGSPSIASALDRFKAQSVDRVVALPLYPQYSAAATGSSIEALWQAAGSRWNTPFIQIVPPFYDHPAFIAAFAESAQPAFSGFEAERVLFSYHGLPQRQIRKSDESGAHCLVQNDCCERIGAANRNCYRAQCFATTRLLADALDLPQEKCVVSFQSRLGRDPWIEPYTDHVLPQLAREGVKRIAVLTPAFVADCLETLEEIGMRAVEDWQAVGGERLELAPCPNASDTWADAVVTIARDSSRWIGG
jgi:ferrochelatase